MAIISSKQSLRGAVVPHRKHTSSMVSTSFFDVPELIIPMQQHMGAPCQPVVKKGDQVHYGDLIGDSSEFFSAPIHASCSGEVLRIEKILTVTGAMTQAVVIQNDGAFTLSKTAGKPEIHNKQEFLAAVRASGAVGLGGAGFPMHVKLAYKDSDKIRALVVNAAECEPYITADHRACLEDTDDILAGIALVKQYLDIPDAYIGIESNKPDALALLDQKSAHDPQIHVVSLKSLYPQGAEKSLIYATTGIVVEAGRLPADCGVLVMNVSSLGFLGAYFRTGMPLTTKRLTVDGDCVKKPHNLIVPIGTPLKELLAFCDTEEHYEKLLMGGPMMGLAVHSADLPVIKNNNAILAFSKNAIAHQNTTACIRCGKCISGCPMKLMPVSLEAAYDARDVAELEALSLNVCISCGCCSFICPAKRQLAQKHLLAKAFLRQQSAK